MSFPILKLPPEVVRCIFDQIESSFFHEDPGRLTISKPWFEFALPASLRHVKLAQPGISLLIASGTHAAELQPLKRNLEVLELGVGGLQAGKEEAVTDEINQLAQILRESCKLSVVYVRSRPFWFNDEDVPRSERNGLLLLPVMRVVFSMENLSTLVLDLEQIEDGYHPCPDISNILGTLRTLKLRRLTICPDCIKPPKPEDRLRLSTVAINLRSATNDAGPLVPCHSKRCGPRGDHHQAPRQLKALKQEMKEQLELLVKQMAAPRIVRLLSFPGLSPITRSETSNGISSRGQTLSYDVLTGKKMVLEEGMAWDDDGEVLRDDEVLSDDDGLPGSEDGLSNYFDTYLDGSDSS